MGIPCLLIGRSGSGKSTSLRNFKKDEIGLITLNRLERWNIFNVLFAKELNSALWKLEREEDIRVIVIKAIGKHFSTGIALNEFKDKNASEYREFIHLMDEHNHTIARMKK